MKKLIFFCIFAMLISCKDNQVLGNHYIDGPTRFVVTDVQNDKSLNYMSIYTVEVIDLNGFSYYSGDSNRNLSITFTDSKNKFWLGQVINFDQLK